MSSIADTWASRDLPVLAAVFRRIDAGQASVNAEEIRTELDMDGLELRVALEALDDAGYIEHHVSGGWTRDHATGLVTNVTERARRELGAWPAPENLATQIARALQSAADSETDPERKGKLRAAAHVVAGMAREVVIQAIAARLGRL